MNSKLKFMQILRDKTMLKNELMAGTMLFLFSFFSIQLTANLLTSGFETNQSHIIRPVFLFVLPLLAGILTMISGFLFNIPFIILPNMMIALLTMVYGEIYLGYKLPNVFLAVFFGTILFFVFSFFVKEKNWKHWIPEPLIKSFPFVMGGILLFFGLFKSGILTAISSNQVATTLGSSITMLDTQIPVFLGYLYNPLTLMVLLGLLFYLFFNKQNPKYSLLLTFLILAVLGLFIPTSWIRTQISGHISEFKAFGYLGVKKAGFDLLFYPQKSINISFLKSFFTILSQNTGLIKLSFLVFIGLCFQNFFVIHSLTELSKEKKHTLPKPDKKHQPAYEETSVELSGPKLTKMNAFSTFFGFMGSLTSFSYAPESSILHLTNAKSGFTAMFCGLLLLLTAFLSPFGIFSLQASLPLLYIIVGLSLVFSQIKNLHFEKLSDWFPGLLFLFISIITMNPVEGLVIGILFYVLITVLNNFYETKEYVKIYPALWITFGMSLLFILSQIYIEP